MRIWKLVALSLGLISILAASANAEIRLPNVLSDHAVLQRDRPIRIWGWATAGRHLSVRLHQQTATAEVDRVGRWIVTLHPETAGGPYDLTVSGDGPDKVVTDLLVGDVWFASGQSNMEMPLAGFPSNAYVKDGEKEIAAATNPKLRLLVVERKSSDLPLSDISATWTQCTSETAKKFSAVAYFFGREIAAKENIPVGLIDSTWGGTPADSWVSLDTLGSNPALYPAFASRAKFANEQVDLDTVLAAEKRENQAAQAQGQPAPQHPWHPAQASWQPAGLYNAMIAPFTPMSLKGFLWYQGEANATHDRAPYYDTLFASLIGDWRMHFAQGNLPFLYVQISSFNSPGEDWGKVREQQRRVLAVTNTAMAVSLDAGTPDNVHPPDKQTVGQRLALAARSLVYGEHANYSGPVFREATTERGNDGVISMRVWFDHAEGLTPTGSGGFELAGADHHFMPADSRVENDTVLVSSPAVKHPLYVRYGWSSVVTNFLYNADKLPASTFTSERSLLP